MFPKQSKPPACTANLERSSDEDRPGGNTQREEHIPLRKIKKSASLEWSYDNEQPPSVQEISSRGLFVCLFVCLWGRTFVCLVICF